MADSNSNAAKQCRTCGVEKPLSNFYRAACCKDGYRGECKSCVANKQAEYNRTHAAEIAAQKKRAYSLDENRQKRSAEYYRANKDRIKLRSMAHYSKNAEAISERRKGNRDFLREQTMAWRSANRERVRRATNNWYHENKERLRPSRKAAKAMRRAPGKIDAGIVSFLLMTQRHRCPVCRASLKGGRYHLDHIKPLARGGSNHRSNLQLLCPSCNLSKSAKDPIDFMRSRGFLL